MTVRFTAERAAFYLGELDPGTGERHVNVRSVLVAHCRGEHICGLVTGRRCPR